MEPFMYTEKEEKELLHAADNLTDSVKVMMVQRRSRLQGILQGRNPVKPRLQGCSDKLKRSAGKLKQLMDIPMDVFLEVASSLSPLDLIHWSRVNTEFRATFLSRSARFVWMRVLERVPDLPPCPPDLTEPQYASLIFEQLCSACDSVRASKVHFTLRVRLCSACEGGNIRRGRNAHPYPSWPFKESIYHLLPPGNPKNDEWDNYLVSEISLVIEECCAFKDDAPALQRYMHDRQIMATALIRHGLAVAIWYNARQRELKAAKRDILTERREAIYAKIEELHWDCRYYPTQAEVINQSRYRRVRFLEKDMQTWHNLIIQRKALTEKSWKSLRPKLEEIYDQLKQKELEKQSRTQSALSLLFRTA